MSHPYFEHSRPSPHAETARQGLRRSPNGANERRRLSAAARQSQRAQAALDVLAGQGVSTGTVWRKRWIDVLRLRAADSESSLAQLAASMSPPMTKSAFSRQLDRAISHAGLDSVYAADDPPSASDGGPTTADDEGGGQAEPEPERAHRAAELAALGGRR